MSVRPCPLVCLRQRASLHSLPRSANRKGLRPWLGLFYNGLCQQPAALGVTNRVKKTVPRYRSPVKLEVAVAGPASTALGGVVVLLELLASRRVLAALPEAGGGRSQGWSDGQMMLAVLLLNVAGFDRVSDIDRLEADRGLCALVRRFEPRLFGVSRGSIARRFRGGRERCFPSARSVRDWLDRFHVVGVHDAGREKGCAFIAPPGARHDLLREVNRRLVAAGVRQAGRLLGRRVMEVFAIGWGRGRHDGSATRPGSTSQHDADHPHRNLHAMEAQLP